MAHEKLIELGACSLEPGAINFMNNKKGYILIITIIMLSFFTLVGLSLIALLFSRITLVQSEVDRQEALYLAEGGLAKSLYEIRTGLDPDGDGIGNVSKKKLNAGEYWAIHDYKTSTITAFGEVNRAVRTVQISYSTL